MTVFVVLRAPVDFYRRSTAPQFDTLDRGLTEVGETFRQGASGESGQTLVRVPGWAESEGLEVGGADVRQPTGRPGVLSTVYAQDAADRVAWVVGRAIRAAFRSNCGCPGRCWRSSS
ncbi:hypothetical protein [Kitasatospora sp. NPDC088134]|uniref:hypothetical protein n=1 Tax=Kitasatospora sp. NPDC088134 TaxID=3364071 RepID=UPI0037FC2F5B